MSELTNDGVTMTRIVKLEGVVGVAALLVFGCHDELKLGDGPTGGEGGAAGLASTGIADAAAGQTSAAAGASSSGLSGAGGSGDRYCAVDRCVYVTDPLDGCDGEVNDPACGAPPESRCGNGVMDSGEICDDGNRVSSDGCSAT